MSSPGFDGASAFHEILQSVITEPLAQSQQQLNDIIAKTVGSPLAELDQRLEMLASEQRLSARALESVLETLPAKVALAVAEENRAIRRQLRTTTILLAATLVALVGTIVFVATR